MLFIITVLGVLYVILTYVFAWFLPFLFAFLIATLLQKPINGILEHSGLNRRVIAPVVTAILVALVLLALGFILVKLITQTAAFVVQLPEVFNTSAPAFLERCRSTLRVWWQGCRTRGNPACARRRRISFPASRTSFPTSPRWW